MATKQRLGRAIFDAGGHASLDTPAFKVGAGWWGCEGSYVCVGGRRGGGGTPEP